VFWWNLRLLKMREVYSDIDLKNFPRKKILSSLQKKTIETRMIQLNCKVDLLANTSLSFWLEFFDVWLGFIKEIFDAYNDRQIWFFLEFINLEGMMMKIFIILNGIILFELCWSGEFKRKGINDFFRQQANSSVLLQEIHPEMVNIVPIVANNDNEAKMIEFLQKLNAFSDTIILSFE